MNTEIIAILDRSGSMSRLQASAIAGYNEFIDGQRDVPGECRVSLVIFDHAIDRPYSNMLINSVPRLDSSVFYARGNTALYDAIGSTLDREGKRIATEGWADKVIVAILTDGAENGSRQYRADQVRSMISHAQEHGWGFVFLAANQDAFVAGANLGIAREHTYNFAASAEGTRAAYANMSASTTAMRGTTF